jgi:probable HAF family extracellular repeat protein
MTDLGMIAGSPNSQADFINSKTQIVGGSFTCEFSAPRAFLWEDGSMVDLNTLISPDSPFYLYWASSSMKGGDRPIRFTSEWRHTHALLLVPCDENHPDIEDCEYSPVDGSATETSVSSMAVTREPTPAACDGIADAGRLNDSLRGCKTSAGWLFVTDDTLRTFLECFISAAA